MSGSGGLGSDVGGRGRSWMGTGAEGVEGMKGTNRFLVTNSK